MNHLNSYDSSSEEESSVISVTKNVITTGDNKNSTQIDKNDNNDNSVNKGNYYFDCI